MGVSDGRLPLLAGSAARAPSAHGGPDARGAAPFDFSTNSNACGPYAPALARVQQADATRYPDPTYTDLRARLAALHGVAPARIALAASASEFIHRITALAAQRGANAVALPTHSYVDYADAAHARGLQPLRPSDTGYATAELQWACEPSSPLGGADPAWAAWRRPGGAADVAPSARHGAPAVFRSLRVLRVLDCAYAPLRLHGADAELHHAAAGSEPWGVAPVSGVWQLWTPNKALGLTGVRAAYAVAPAEAQAEADVAALAALSPSWPIGAHGVAMLRCWIEPCTQRWLAHCLPVLREWKALQEALCRELGWSVVPGSLANYFCAQVPTADLAAALGRLRTRGVQLRDCTALGLPGTVRLGVLPPVAQHALREAWRAQ